MDFERGRNNILQSVVILVERECSGAEGVHDGYNCGEEIRTRASVPAAWISFTSLCRSCGHTVCASRDLYTVSS